MEVLKGFKKGRKLYLTHSDFPEPRLDSAFISISLRFIPLIILLDTSSGNFFERPRFCKIGGFNESGCFVDLVVESLDKGGCFGNGGCF